MIPVQLTFSAFGPYRQRQEVDFASFLEKGLVLIRGETGAGKTALLDAMTYALYGRSSGGGRGDLASMRCLAASPEEETRVEYRFRVREKEYLFARWLRVKKKRTGQLEYEPAQNVFYRDEEGNDVPFFANPKQRDLEAKAQELIGLTYDQFRQVMILPQGQFERLLTSKSDEKEAILTTLFHAQRWDAIAQILWNRAAERQNALKEETAALEGALESCGARDLAQLEEIIGARKEEQLRLTRERSGTSARLEEERKALEGEQRLEELFRQAEEASAVLERLNLRREESAARQSRLERGKAAARLDPAWNRLETARQEEKRRREEEGLARAHLTAAGQKAEEAGERSRRWEGEAPRMEREEKERLRLEERLPDYARMDQARQKARETLALLKTCREEYRRVQAAEQAARAARDELSARQKDWLTRYLRQLPALEEEARRLDRGREITQRLLELGREKTRRESVLFTLEERGKEAAAQAEKLRREAQLAREASREKLLAQLARELGEGEPCPLCGSVHHPALHGSREAENVDMDLREMEARLLQAEEKVRQEEKGLLTARLEQNALLEEEGRLREEEKQYPADDRRLEEVRTLLAEARAKERELPRLEDELTRAEGEWTRAQNRLEELRVQGTAANEAEQKARAQWEALAARIEPDIPDEKALREKIARLERRIGEEKLLREKDRAAWEEAVRDREKADAVWQRAQEELKNAQTGLTGAQLDWETACRGEELDGEEAYLRAHLSPDQLTRLEEECRREEEDRRLARERLAQAKQAIGGAEKPATAARREAIAALEEELARWDGQLGAAKQQLARLEEVRLQTGRRLEELERSRREADKLTAFARGLRGSSGISLGRFVLGVMLSSVTAEANRLLEGVHGGRYRLYRTSEGTGRTKRVGLELEVLDGFSGKRRSVASLSGGEKFLVALTLALGLSAVVQAQSGGVRMEALFIDEGFGSLDPSSIQDALGVLAAVAGSRRLVGIISHVEALEENIPASIQVVKDREGSRLRFSF